MRKNESDRIKELRNHLGLSQEAMAKSIGVSKQYFSRVEKGLTSLSKEKVVALCEEYKVSIDWLLNGTGSMMQQDEEISEKFFQNADNLNNFNKILNVYNLYLKNVFKIIENKYPDATFDEKLTTASILFNQDCVNQNIPFNDLESIRKKIEKNRATAEEFEIRVLGTYYPVRVQQGRD